MSATVARPARGLPVLVVVFVVLALTGSLRADDLLVSGFTSDNVVRYHPISGGPLGTLQPGSGLDGAQSVTTGPDGRLYVCSENTNRVLRYERSTGAFVDVFVNPGNGLNAPTGAIFGPDSTGDGHPDLYVASFNGDSVLLYDGADGSFVSVFVSPGSGGLNGPDAGIAFGPDGHLYVPSYWNDRVLRYDGATGAFLGAFVGPGSGGLVRPRVVRFRPSDGRVVVSSEGSNKVLLYDQVTGDPLGTLLNISSPSGLRFARDGSLYVASVSNNSVNRYDGDSGAFQDVTVTPGSGGLVAPTFVAMTIPADVAVDGRVNVDDLVALLLAWGACPPAPDPCPADVNGDGTVDVDDLLALLLAWD